MEAPTKEQFDKMLQGLVDAATAVERVKWTTAIALERERWTLTGCKKAPQIDEALRNVLIAMGFTQ